MAYTTGCVVIPTYRAFLDVMTEEQNAYTALIWPGHSAKANRMASPYKWINEASPDRNTAPQMPQKAIPFLFRGVQDEAATPPFEVSHVALAVYIANDEDY